LRSRHTAAARSVYREGLPNVLLRDGRRLTYSDQGQPTNPAIFFFHGTPGSRVLTPATTLPLRIIAFDRPGYGGSGTWPRRQLLDWTRDVAELADALDIDSFSVVGASGGGPHALACAVSLPDRIVAAAVVSGPAPLFEKPGNLAALDHEDGGIVQLARRDIAAARQRMDARGQWILDLLAEPEGLVRSLRVESDRQLLTNPQLHALVLESLRESVQQGLEGYAWDWLANRLPWGFTVRDIRVPVRIWHGTFDHNVPFDDAVWLAAAISGGRLTTWTGEGHWALFAHADDVFTDIANLS
jgi:pimeloyl-ACP methyl ester carboxylesterase